MAIPKLHQVLLSDKQFRILKCVEQSDYILGVSKLSDVTYSHVYKVMLYFEKIGLVKLSKTVHRKRSVCLSEKGKEVLDIYYRVYTLLKGDAI